MLNLEDVYTKKFCNDGSHKSLGWGSEYSQQARFRALVEISGFSNKDSVLDVGCGYGDLSIYIVNYTGIDLRQSAISVANSKYNDKFLCKSIYKIKDKFDWVFASGIFSLGYDEWLKDTTNTIIKMFDTCKKGIAFNCLSSLSNKNIDPDNKFVDINEIVPIISRLTNKFSIRHDYLPNDVTFYLYK